MIKTCNFNNYIGSSGVSIALVDPKWYRGERYPDLASPDWLCLGFKLGRINELDYIEYYYDLVLSKLDYNKVYNDLNGKTMLCHCKYFCHRHIVAEWLARNVGIEIIEAIK